VTITEILTGAAAYHKKVLADLTVNSLNLGIVAANQVRLNAELAHDFNFQRKLLTLDVDSVAGGSLDDAVIYDTTTEVAIKTILDIGQVDEDGNFIPVEWTTVEEGLERQRATNTHEYVRYANNEPWQSSPSGQRRFTIMNNRLYSWPKTETSETLSVQIEAYIFSGDWQTGATMTVASATGGGSTGNGTYSYTGTHNGFNYYTHSDGVFVCYFDGDEWIIANSLVSTTNSYAITATGAAGPAGTYTGQGTFTGTPTVTVSGATTEPVDSVIWTSHGQKFLFWGIILELNHYFKTFVGRTEGNLAPPQAQMDLALEAFKQWDVYKYEQSRRHGR
jgi:hypothetical protein